MYRNDIDSVSFNTPSYLKDFVESKSLKQVIEKNNQLY